MYLNHEKLNLISQAETSRYSKETVNIRRWRGVFEEDKRSVSRQNL